MQDITHMGRIVTHFFCAKKPNEGLRIIEFISREDSNNDGLENRPFSIENLRGDIERGSLIAVDHKQNCHIGEDQAVWLDNKGDVYIASYLSPFDDYKKGCVYRGIDSVLRSAEETDTSTDGLDLA
jgi:hypothetical protein